MRGLHGDHAVCIQASMGFREESSKGVLGLAPAYGGRGSAALSFPLRPWQCLMSMSWKKGRASYQNATLLLILQVSAVVQQ